MATTLAARRTKGSRAPVTSFELLFDLVYVFAITQVSHTLLASLTPEGALQSLVLWLAVWLGWQYTCWFTNWFNPDNPKVRLTLAVTMLAALVMAVALPKAFADQGLVFAVAYAGMQVSRAAVAVWLMQPDDPLRDNYRRILGWSGIAAVLWIAGAFAVGPLRLVLWILAIACEQGAPAFGFWLPGLGRSRTSDWTIDGGHLAERCQLVVIVALGEAIMMTGAPLAADGLGHVPEFIAFTVAFVGSITLWWVYFDTGSARVSHAIESAADPGRIGSLYHYLHALLVGGIIVAAVGNDLTIAHPDQRVQAPAAAVLIGGAAAYVLGNGLLKRIAFGRFPLSHVVGLRSFRCSGRSPS
ncbi:low temperature requirement protein A [uncultured Alsobacter sp.]|uniref:low temperature requirement protein A n=1 Tax=uncultured Alsobacter sp. TaxID=1748258 RepID=UPI0025D3EE23|nr:low temperature requirement protein A [uncultured Alsobacter sp.]